jgi:hypothetical protein
LDPAERPRWCAFRVMSDSYSYSSSLSSVVED